jgi:glutamine synthetase
LSYRHNSSAHKVEYETNNVKLDGIDFVQIRYTDILGRFLARYFQTDSEVDLDDFFRCGVGVDGSSVKGFANIDESDMILIPDKSTLRIVAPELYLSHLSANLKIATSHRRRAQRLWTRKINERSAICITIHRRISCTK